MYNHHIKCSIFSVIFKTEGTTFHCGYLKSSAHILRPLEMHLWERQTDRSTDNSQMQNIIKSQKAINNNIDKKIIRIPFDVRVV